MSTFAVTRERIGAIRPIPKADRIEIASLAGMDFQFVVGKGAYAVGEEVLYIPIDAVLPADLIEKLGLKGKLAGKDQDRVKTVVLRGAYSQGVVAKVDLVPAGMVNPQQITSHLGITKYDPPPNEVKDGILLPRPEGQSMYDLESADRYTDLASLLMDQEVFVTEKLEGENAWVTAWPGTRLEIGMRDNTIHEKPGVKNRFHEVAKRFEIDGFARKLVESYDQRVAVYWEFLGPGCGVGNYYGLPEPAARIFDVRVGFGYLPPEEFLDRLERFYGNGFHAWVLVPVLAWPEQKTKLKDWLGGQTIKQASNGASVLNHELRREGIVIKPLVEQRDDRIGRLVLKQRSPLYLANTDY